MTLAFFFFCAREGFVVDAKERSWLGRDRLSGGKEPRREKDGRTKRRRRRCGDAGGRSDGF